MQFIADSDNAEYHTLSFSWFLELRKNDKIRLKDQIRHPHFMLVPLQMLYSTESMLAQQL